MSVGLVIVSHSARIADGVVELAEQMADGIRIVAAGGTDAGGLGTSFDLVSAAISAADGGDGVVVLCDLGSAVLTAETAVDLLDGAVEVRIADAPLVEGAVVAAVAAAGGAELAAVVDAAESAAGPRPAPPREAGAAVHAREAASAPAVVTGSAVLTNRDGLHARPASEFARLAGRFEARVTANGVEAKSLLRIMSLGLTAGSEVRLEATGPDAEEAVAALAALVASGFGE